MKFRSRVIAALAVASALALAGCGAGDSGEEPAGGGGTLTLGMAIAPTTFEAANFAWSNEAPYAQAVYDTLLKASPTNEILPSLATEWEYDAAKTSLTLTLRDDVEFTDGTAFDASVAAENILRFRDGTSQTAASMANVVDAVAEDDTHLVITLSQPDPGILLNLTKNAGLQESPEAFDSPDVQTVPVGSGPYTLDTDATVTGSEYTFVKNPDYWNPDDQHYDKVVMKVFASGTAILSAIQGGQLNGSITYDNTTNPQIEAAGYTIAPLELNWEGMILFDRDGTMNPALGDVRVRQAINYAFDRDALLEALGGGYGTVTGQVFPTTSGAYDGALDDYYSYDPEKAKELLAEAGYPDGFTIQSETVAAFQSTLDLMKSQLADIGITIEYENVELGDYIANQLVPKYAATWMALQEDPSDWGLIGYQIAENATWNPFHATTPELEDLISQLSVAEGADADEIAKEINTYVVEEAWFAPWFRQQTSFAVDAKTTVEVQPGNPYPYLYNFKPAN